VELLHPNKADALAYLESESEAPVRYARVVVQFGATLEPYMQEYQVGPLPAVSGTTQVAPLDSIYNKGRGYQRIYDADMEELALFNYEIGASVANITQALLGGVSITSLRKLVLTVSPRWLLGPRMIHLRPQAILR
jgi:primary-amine oxidase